MIAALAFMVIVLALGVAMTTMATSEQKSTRAGGQTLIVRNLAEAGIERALNQMNTNPVWRCTGSPVDFTDKPLVETVGGATTTIGTYTVDPIIELGGDYLQVTAHGYSPAANGRGKLAKQVRVIAYKRWGTPFSAAAFGRNGVPLANGETDSYNSDPATGGGTYGGTNVGTKGDIRTDSTNPSAITILNNGHCGGNVIYGPSTNLNSVTLDRSRISGSVLSAPATATMPDVAIPGDAIPISRINGGRNAITGSLAIPAGTYYCDSISLTGNSIVTTSGRVYLYVTGSMFIGGNGIVNNNDMTGRLARPCDLILYGTPTCTSVSISGNGALSAAVYAPEADIVLNGAGTSGNVYGSLAGKTVSFNGNGTVLHYDEALQNVKGVVTGFSPKSWEED
jgi:hypothetical protein